MDNRNRTDGINDNFMLPMLINMVYHSDCLSNNMHVFVRVYSHVCTFFYSETFSFMLTGEDGSRRFGYCRRLLVSHCWTPAPLLPVHTPLSPVCCDRYAICENVIWFSSGAGGVLCDRALCRSEEKVQAERSDKGTWQNWLQTRQIKSNHPVNIVASDEHESMCRDFSAFFVHVCPGNTSGKQFQKHLE